MAACLRRSGTARSRRSCAVQDFVFRYVQSLEDVPRMKKAKDNASNYCQAQLYRALWTCSYWHQQELKDCSRWGFSSTCG